MKKLEALKKTLQGKLHWDDLHKSIYATDASVYRKIPMAVAYPKNENDIKKLITFAQENNTTLIPRTAGTSLAGQCVGDGIVVDVSKYFTKILSLDKKNKTIVVQPGVIRDNLNRYLKPFGLFFGPNTSTSNRCMIGGMVGNNSSGTTSIKYGITSDKILEIKTILSDGTDAIFNEITAEKFHEKRKQNSLEGKIYQKIFEDLSNEQLQKEIQNNFPKSEIHRRNTGYAIDILLETNVFFGKKNINLSRLLCGSEGTLAFSTEITLQLDNLPPKESIMVASQFKNLKESLQAVTVAMQHNLYTCELMDKTILDCTKNNRKQTKNRSFIKGNPQAILMLEICTDNINETEKFTDALILDLQKNNFGYKHSKLKGDNIKKAMELRKAGLGLLGNIIGDKKAVACIEDTAVTIQDLPNYIEEFTHIMDKYKQACIYYAHAGAGEIHLRPILNLKKKKDVVLFRKITESVVHLVKKYKGSLSGEHGDGIVRSEFMELMLGKKVYQSLRELKYTFDPKNIFNKGKIIYTEKMDENLRYEIDREEPEIKTLYNFLDNQGVLRAAEKCNGSGDCRKPYEAGGTMCPSYRATKNEKDTTRARANALREFLTNSTKINKFDHKELKESFDLCLSCKACASECPSSLDIATMKSEFLYQYQLANGFSLRSKLFAHNSKINQFISIFPKISNFFVNTKITKKIMGIAIQRNLPKLSKKTLRKIYNQKYEQAQNKEFKNGFVYLFCDEFTNYYDSKIGIDTIELLNDLGYGIKMIKHQESGRAYISKGFLIHAKNIANTNIDIFKNIISKKTPLIGMEPSSILTFRDEYLRLANDIDSAKKIAKYTYTIEEFIQREINAKKIQTDNFTTEEKTIKIHGHCHQKSLSNIVASFTALNIPSNFKVTIIPSGCCGMAGSFGYEKEHYDISMKVGQESIFSKLKNITENDIVCTSGTSCMHQIYDGTGIKTMHPSTILKSVLKK